ncbi:MAG: PEP-CTERM sorting domain-containing protein [Sphingopyxis sp.]|nr:PEP-CTERM sorting domain-containing protein [Sphingopyxis sp.]
MQYGHGIWLLIGAAALAVAPAVSAKESAPAPTAAGATPSTPAKAAPKTILFIGNSFTQGAHSAARNWRAGSVTDLNNAGYGGVPALFKLFTQQAGLAYDVSLETQGGKSLGFHYDERRQLFDRPWDIVVLQEFSTLDRDKPGDPGQYMRNVDRLAALFKARNPAVDIRLAATWTRADQTYKSGGHWYGKPVTAMADDLRAAADRARAANPSVAGIVPVGQAWNRAMTTGVADPDPYDGIGYGQLDLWAYDHYHASVAGYYLSALVTFGAITGIDPTTLGAKEKGADELGLSDAQAAALQAVARDVLLADRG